MSKRIYVAMSGGVDSSVTSALLKERGYNVTGVYFKTYKPDGNTEYCRSQGMDAKRVCDKLNIPFKVFDLQDDYRKKVFNYMIGEYKRGRTPNPDVICNKEIKFGSFLRNALDDGADMIATGHYARLYRGLSIRGETLSYVKLLKGVDNDKDQSYFLSQLSQSQLGKAMFPIGKFLKSEIRNLARKYELHTADKPDSQGICFIGKEMNVKDFLKRHINEKPGYVLDVSGRKIGEHYGAVFYTIGERHDFKIYPSYYTSNMQRMFVISKDVDQNTITVGTNTQLHSASNRTMVIEKTNWISEMPKIGKKYTCRIRHRGELYPCEVEEHFLSRNRTRVRFHAPPLAVAIGQFAAFYNDDICLGGGIITY